MTNPTRDELEALAAKLERSSLVGDELTSRDKLLAADALRLAAQSPEPVAWMIPEARLDAINLSILPPVTTSPAKADDWKRRGLNVVALYTAHPQSASDGALREALKDLEAWCDNQGALLGAVDGYDYRSGKGAAYRYAAIEIGKRIKSLAASGTTKSDGGVEGHAGENDTPAGGAISMFRVGQKVVCVETWDAGGKGNGDEIGPVNGTIYTVRHVGTGLNPFFHDILQIRLVEIVNPTRNYRRGLTEVAFFETAFRATRFRPIVSRPTSIEFAHEILRSVSVPTKERAHV